MIAIDDGCFMGPIPEKEEIKRFHMKSVPSGGSRQWILFRFVFILFYESRKPIKKIIKGPPIVENQNSQSTSWGHVENIRRETAEEEKERSSMSNNV